MANYWTISEMLQIKRMPRPTKKVNGFLSKSKPILKKSNNFLIQAKLPSNCLVLITSNEFHLIHAQGH